MPDKLFDNLENFYLFDKKHDAILAKLEAVLGLVGGAFLGSFLCNYNKNHLAFAVILSAIFLYLFYRRLSKESKFSVTTLGELRSTIALENAEKEIERKILIEDHINDSIKFLNSNTCNYNLVNSENNFCEQGLSNGLESIYHPYLKNLPAILNTTKTKFTVGAYVNGFLTLPPEFGITVSDARPDRDIFIPRDELEFGQNFAKDLLVNPDLLDLSFLFQTHFLNTFKHGKFLTNSFLRQDKEFTLITAPIPKVSEDGAVGVFFIISEKLASIPPDLENVTNVFSRLFSNWLSKYNECIFDRCFFMAEKLLLGHEQKVAPETKSFSPGPVPVLPTEPEPVPAEADNDTLVADNKKRNLVEAKRNLTNMYAKKDLFQGSLGL